jgi:hypothetical protein
MRPEPVEHTLVVGGTGMLAQAAMHLAARARHLTMVARTEQSLQRFGMGLAERGLQATLVAVDYQNPSAFLAAIDRAIARHGVPGVVLGWFHNSAPALALARHLAGRGQPVRFFHVLGSASASPVAGLAEQRAPYETLRGIEYHQIVLGFVVEGERSRWLTQDEISFGVIEAMAAERATWIVGTVEPWSARP